MRIIPLQNGKKAEIINTALPQVRLYKRGRKSPYRSYRGSSLYFADPPTAEDLAYLEALARRANP